MMLSVGNARDTVSGLIVNQGSMHPYEIHSRSLIREKKAISLPTCYTSVLVYCMQCTVVVGPVPKILKAIHVYQTYCNNSNHMKKSSWNGWFEVLNLLAEGKYSCAQNSTYGCNMSPMKMRFFERAKTTLTIVLVS